MDISTISSAYSGLKYAKEILGTLLNAKIEAETILRINEVLNNLGDAQDALFTLREELSKYQDENSALRAQLKAVHDWQAKAKNYSLNKTSGGAVVYRFNSEPTHFACPVCFEKEIINILQDRRVISGHYDCPSCKAVYPVDPYEKISFRH